MDETVERPPEPTIYGYMYIHKVTGERRITHSRWDSNGKKWPKNWDEYPLTTTKAVKETPNGE